MPNQKLPNNPILVLEFDITQFCMSAILPWKNKCRARSTVFKYLLLSLYPNKLYLKTRFPLSVCSLQIVGLLVLLLQCARTMSESSGYADMRLGETILVFQYRERRKTFQLMTNQNFLFHQMVLLKGARRILYSWDKTYLCPLSLLQWIWVHSFYFFTWKHILQENKWIVLTDQNTGCFFKSLKVSDWVSEWTHYFHFLWVWLTI